MFHIQRAAFTEYRPAVMVVSHERSGTHFLMNSLAACYGYVSDPWINLDYQPFNINYFAPTMIADLLLSLTAAEPLASVVKAHHPADFFGAELPRLTEHYVIFYIYRHPAAVMRSFWRFLHHWPWFEGPRVANPAALAGAEPCGQLMRYQTRQYPTMLARWAAHVDGWLARAADNSRIVPVRFEDLDGRYEDTMLGLAHVLGRSPYFLARPRRDQNVIPGAAPDLGHCPANLEALTEHCRQLAGSTMSRFGY